MKTVKPQTIPSILILIGVVFCLSCQKEDLEISQHENDNLNFISEYAALRISENLVPSNSGIFDSRYSDIVTEKVQIVESIQAIQDETDRNALYIINYKKGGFVILSADSRISPILASSDKGYFPLIKEIGNSPFASWMTTMLRQIELVRSNSGSDLEFATRQWDNLISPQAVGGGPGDCENEITTVGPLVSTEWDQETGYNESLPAGSTFNCPSLSHAYAGCVPIAIAQIMKYNEHPTSYSWNLMPDIGGSSTIQDFIEDLHDNLPVNYDCNSTGVAPTYDIADFLETDYNYTNAEQGPYSFQTVKTSLYADKPVILSGRETAYSEGHTWVCDGFRENVQCMYDGNGDFIGTVVLLYLHMNWGQGGCADGWFTYNNFDPVFPSGQQDYNSNQVMVYNITP